MSKKMPLVVLAPVPGAAAPRARSLPEGVRGLEQGHQAGTR